MSRIVVQAFISLDGVVQAPGGADEDRDGGCGYDGRTLGHDKRFADDEGAKIVEEWESRKSSRTDSRSPGSRSSRPALASGVVVSLYRSSAAR